MKTIFITGANRGLGLEFAKQYSMQGHNIIGTARSKETANALTSLPNTQVLELDVSSTESIANLTDQVGDRAIDLLINNAGVGDPSDAGLNADPELWVNAFKVNCIGIVKVAEILEPNLVKSSKAIAATIGSQAGCLSVYRDDSKLIYRTTKAAANAASVLLSWHFKPLNIPYVTLRPGPTKTDLAGPNAQFEVGDTISKLIAVLENVTMEHTGLFLDRTGVVFPWLPEERWNVETVR